jgi:DNA polymerase-3 subunit gamma/tau
MMLYNKWRPALLSDIRGQPHITKTLLSQLRSGRLAHAYLFTGSRGTGKTTCAKILARAVNCLSPQNGEPCNQCVSCLGILAGSVPDVNEIDAASNSGVDNIRSLREELIYTPTSSNKRVYIIDEVHMLSAGAFNALLKTLEEPPGHVLFILATTETHKVPATIVSRCQRFAFRRIEVSVILDQISHICETEGITTETGALELLAQMADGSLRDALSLLEQCGENADGAMTEVSVRHSLGLTGLEKLAQWLRETDDLQKSMGHLEELYQAGMDVTAIMGQLSSLLRDLLMGQMAGDFAGTRLPADEAEKLSSLWPRERIITTLSQISEMRLSRSGSKKLDAELCLIRLAAPMPAGDAPRRVPPPPVSVPPPSKPETPPAGDTSPRIPKPPQPDKPDSSLQDAKNDPRWAQLLASIDNPLLKETLSASGAKVEGDRLIFDDSDPFIQGVLKQAEKQIKVLFPGGTGNIKAKQAENKALDALIASAGDLIIEED